MHAYNAREGFSFAHSKDFRPHFKKWEKKLVPELDKLSVKVPSLRDGVAKKIAESII